MNTALTIERLLCTFENSKLPTIFIAANSQLIWYNSRTKDHPILLDKLDHKGAMCASYLASEGTDLSTVSQYLIDSMHLDNRTNVRFELTFEEFGGCVYAAAQLKTDAEKKQGLNVVDLKDYFKSLLENGKDLIALLDPSGNYIYVSPTSRQVLGIKAEEFIGKNAFDFIHPDDRNRVAKNLSKLEKVSKCVIKPFRFKDAMGRWRWVETVLTNLLKDPHVNAIVANSRDVTDIKNEELNQKFLNKISDIFIHDYSLNLTFERMVIAACKFFEARVGEVWIVGTQTYKFRRLKRRGKQFVSHSGQALLEGELLSKHITSGDVLLLYNRSSEERLVIPFYANGKVLGALVLASESIRSLYDQKQKILRKVGGLLGSELIRKQQQDELNYLFTSAPDLLCLIDKEGKFLRVNPTFCTLLGFSKEELLSSNFIDFVHPEDREATLSEYLETISGKRETNGFVNRYLSKSGKAYWISWCSSKVFGHEGLAFGFGRNITESKMLDILWNKAFNTARIGNWEVVVRNENDFDVFWSDMTRQLMGVDTYYNQSITGGFELFEDESGKILIDAFDKLIKNDQDFDAEVKIKRNDGTEFWVRCIGDAEKMDDGGIRIYGSIQDIDQRKQLEIELEKKTKYLKSLTVIISTFLKNEDWFSVIDECFEIIGNTVCVDRVYYFENFQDSLNGQELCSQRFEWSSSGKLSQIDNPILQNIPVENFAPFFEPLKGNNPFVAVVSKITDDLLRTNLEDQEIKSILVLPIFVANSFYGFIGFDDCTKEREWSFDELNYLAIFTSNLAAAIQRRNNRKELEVALSERNTILESIQDGFYAIDSNWSVTYWNRKAEEILNISKEVAIGKRIWDIYPEFKLGKSMQYCKHVFSKKEMSFFEEMLSGTNRWFEVNVYPAKDGLSVYFKEITRRKCIEEELRISNERYVKVTEATSDAIWDWDMLAGTLFRGEGFKVLFGHATDILTNVDEAIDTFVHPKDQKALRKSLNVAVNDPERMTWIHQYRFRRSDGTFAHVIDRSVIVRDSNRLAIRIVGAITDITERYNYEDSLRKLNQDLEKRAKQLAASNSELEQFAYVASHDLQEPLRMISSFMGLLQKKYVASLDAKALQYIHFAVDGASRMRQIILDLLEYSRVGQDHNDLEKIALEVILNDIIFLNRTLIQNKNAQVNWNNLPSITAPKISITLIFQNLIGNALKYSKDGVDPIIQINCLKEREYWLFSVSDNGIGIEEVYFERIFTVFKRLWSHTEYPGTGMGLAIVKKIVEALGGEIWVESTPSVGSTFYFRIKRVKSI